ncbi:MAG TPA: hypothetical protein DGT23_25365 [Micromonosporaceae bacterium]|nr:hypothetical protein [Micromonosporaceae bacterium]
MILDTSAVAAYSKGSIHVGEVLAELHDEPEVKFALPVICLAEAGKVADDVDQLVLLAQHERAVTTPLRAEDWLDLINLSMMLGRVDCAATFLGATQNRAYLLTATPDRYPDSEIIIDVGH